MWIDSIVFILVLSKEKILIPYRCRSNSRKYKYVSPNVHVIHGEV
jgi:hypothetical protein